MCEKNALNGKMYQKHNLVRLIFIPSDLGLCTSVLKQEQRKDPITFSLISHEDCIQEQCLISCSVQLS